MIFVKKVKHAICNVFTKLYKVKTLILNNFELCTLKVTELYSAIELCTPKGVTGSKVYIGD